MLLEAQNAAVCLRDLYEREQRFDNPGKGVNGDRIETIDNERRSPFRVPLDIDKPIKRRQTNQRPPSHKDAVGARPQILIDGEPHIQNYSKEQHENSRREY